MGTVAAPKQVQRAAAAGKPVTAPLPPSRIAAPKGSVNGAVQCASLKVSHPNDPAEREAEDVARRVVNAPPSQVAQDSNAPNGQRHPGVAMQSPHVARMMNAIVQRESAVAHLLRTCTPPTLRGSPVIQREARSGAAAGKAHIASLQEGRPNVSANLAAEIRGSKSSGNPLPPSVRRFMEQRFEADFSQVRVHTDDAAAKRNQALNARAFTVGGDVHFGAGEFQPDHQAGRELIAHELTHTIQQGAAPQGGAAVQRSVAVREQSAPQAQRGWTDYLPSLPDPREYIAGKAANIPGFTLFTVVIGFNPITNASVDRSAGNILRGAIELIPGGTYITEALANHGIFDKVSSWVQTQFDAIKDIGSGIWDAITSFISGIKLTDLGDIGELWERGKSIITGPVNQAIAFAINLKNGIVQLVKDTILKPIGAFARTTSGYPLLCSIMGHDPITGEPAPQDADALMGGFLTFIGEGELWAKMKNANAVPRAFAWFNGAVAALKGFVSEIPGLFVAAFQALEIMDIILIPRAFGKLANIFGGFAGRFISWGAQAAWDLLEIIFDVVKPGAMAYVKRTGAALKSILKNPMPFVGNLVAAGKLGFSQFSGNFLKHLKAGLLEWLKGALPGVYIPTAFELKEILKFVLSVLGLTWANMRLKLVKVVGEPAVVAMEEGFKIVVTLVKEGPAAAWEQLKESLGNLKDMAVGAITDFVVDMVVTKAVPKILAMFIPGAGFIGAIVSIYDTIMVFVQKMSKIAEVIGAFVNSIVQIAAGNIGAAAKRVESVLAGMLSLAISFLAGFAGLNKIGDKIMGVIQKIRAPIDKAIDGAINWVVSMAKKMFAKAFGKDKKDERTPAQKQADLDKAIAEAQALMADPKTNSEKIRKKLGKIKSKYKMQSLEVVIDKDSDLEEKLHIEGVINPKKGTEFRNFAKDKTVGPLGIVRSDISWYSSTKDHFNKELEAKLKAEGKNIPLNPSGGISYVKAEVDIRHKVSASDMISATDNLIKPQQPPDAANTLLTRPKPAGAQGNYFSGDKNKPTKVSIVQGAMAYIRDMFNEIANLFLGGMSFNRSLGKRYDAGDKGKTNAKTHVQYRKAFIQRWGLPSDTKITLDIAADGQLIQESGADRDAKLGN